VGFHRKKTIYLKNTAKILHDKYNGDIPSTLEEIEALPGVGPKMARLVMQIAWKKSVGIAVDVHVHRICNRLKWVQKTKRPEQTRMELEEWVPREYWAPLNKLLVGFGQIICTPIKPKCHQCSLHNVCPSSSYKS